MIPLVAAWACLLQPQDNFPDVPENHDAYEAFDKLRAEHLIRSVPERLMRGPWPHSRTEFVQFTVEAVKNVARPCDDQLDDLAEEANETGKSIGEVAFAKMSSYDPTFDVLFKRFYRDYSKNGTSVASLKKRLALSATKAQSAKDKESLHLILRGGPVLPDTGAARLDYAAWRRLSVHWIDVPEFENSGASPPPQRLTRDEFAALTIAVTRAASSKMAADADRLNWILEHEVSPDDRQRASDYIYFYQGRAAEALNTLVSHFAPEIRKQGVNPAAMSALVTETGPLAARIVETCRRILVVKA